MSDLVTLAEVKAQLRIAPDMNDEDGDLTLKLQAAQAIVLAHLTKRDDGTYATVRDTWTEATVPLTVKHAILMQVTELYAFRGDDRVSDDRPKGGLSRVIESLLIDDKDPGVA